jgi:epoxyqueuosine reductase
VLERDLAQRAGIGFVGRHTGLVSRTFGNWFLLAEILTTVALEPDPPARNLCGSCTRCLDACPTGALPAPFTLDARRCVSYLTIEHRGPIPEALRPLVGDRVFGCDDCLAACPWNRFAREGALMRPHRRDDLGRPGLEELLGLDEDAFRRRFDGTPILRTRRRGLLRNACVALGNTGDARSLPALARAAADPEPLVAEHAAWALGRIRARLAGSPAIGAAT